MRALAAAQTHAPGEVVVDPKKPAVVIKQARLNLFSGEIVRAQGPSPKINVQVSAAQGSDEVTPQELIAFLQQAIADIEAKL